MKITETRYPLLKSNLLLITIALILFTGCAFQKELENTQALNLDNLNDLNGKYSVNAIDEQKPTKKYWMYNNFLVELDRKLLTDTLKIDSAQTYTVELNFVNDKILKINYLEDNKIIRERTLRTTLKKDGYLYLKNKNVGFVGLPYVFGGIDIKRTRLSKTTSGDLIFDVVNHRSGSFLIICFLDGRTWKYRNIYPRIP